MPTHMSTLRHLYHIHNLITHHVPPIVSNEPPMLKRQSQKSGHALCIPENRFAKKIETCENCAATCQKRRTPPNAELSCRAECSLNVIAENIERRSEDYSKVGSAAPPQSGILSPGLRLRFTSIRPHLSSHSFPGSLKLTFHGSSNAENLPWC